MARATATRKPGAARRRQTRRQESHDQQVDRLKKEVEELREQLRQAHRLATMGTMTAMVAHEFNNILTPIINYAQLARTNPALSNKAIGHAEDGGKRARDICEAILGLSRQKSEEPSAQPLRKLVDSTLSAMARPPQKDGIDLDVDVPARLNVPARGPELQQILLNLIINAREAVLASPNRPRRIALSARRRDGRVRLSVSDNGTGIPPENIERIFKPFFTTRDEPDADSHGHGLGLTVCREIVDAMGGQIEVDSRPGCGATFTIDLPH